MKSVRKIYCSIAIVIGLTSCSANFDEIIMEDCAPLGIAVNQSYTKSAELQQVLIELTQSGIPGVSVAVLSEQGWWTSSAGYAKIEDRTLMQSCHLQYLQSISKTYMAVAILKLYEEGKINLDHSINEYLPERISSYVKDSEKISVRMLLNHTSGVPEYNFDTNYVAELLQHPDRVYQPEDYIKLIDGKDLTFEPGTKFSYRNTNYVLLALIGDYVTGNHSQYMEQMIFEPLSLGDTYYRNDDGYLTYPSLVNSYWDRYGNGIVENSTYLQRQNVSMLVGDDGIVATPVDGIKFLSGLLEGELLAPSTMAELLTWTSDSEGKPRYGLGIDYSMIESHIAYGHGGAGIGAGCELLYFPEKNIYVCIAINLGVVTESKIHRNAEKILDRFYQVLLN